MPINKNAFIRYKIIDELISQGDYLREDLFFTLNDKLERNGHESVSKETLDGDIRSLKKEFNAPIVYQRNRGYRYEESGFRIFTNDLNRREVKALEFALDVLQGNSHVELVKEAQTVINKIYRKTTRLPGSPVILSEMRLDVQGVEFLAPLHTAIVEKNCIAIDYQSRRQQKVVRHYFSPYLLKEYRGLWYVIGYSDQKEFTIVLALDRIKSIREAHVSFHADLQFNADRYFKYSTGITTVNSATPSKVRFWIQQDAYYFMKIQPLHSSQKIIEELEDGYVVQMQVYLSEELLISLMGLGKRIRVLEPPQLVESIRTHLKELQSFYFS